MVGNAVWVPQQRVAWTLSSDTFDKLLAGFHVDRGTAGTAYEQLHRRLVNFFDWRGCAYPEELTDETFDRVARRLADGEIIKSLPDYCFGMAQKLAWEVCVRQSQPLLWTPRNQAYNLAERQLIVATQSTLEESQLRELQFACLEACLGRLNPANCELVIQYYQTNPSRKTHHRLTLAERLGISLNHLRVRVFRIRAELKRCLGRCFQQGRGDTTTAHRHHCSCWW